MRENCSYLSTGTESGQGTWCPSISGPWALPTLIVPVTSNPEVKGRKIYRRFANDPPSGVLINTVDNTSTVRIVDDAY